MRNSVCLGILIHLWFLAQDQSYQIRGKILDEQLLPIPGAIVKTVDNLFVTTADIGGSYTLSVPDRYNKLLFSSIGYMTDSVNISKSTINCILIGACCDRFGEGFGGFNQNSLVSFRRKLYRRAYKTGVLKK